MRASWRASPRRPPEAVRGAGTPAFPGVTAIDLWDLAAIVPPFCRSITGGGIKITKQDQQLIGF